MATTKIAIRVDPANPRHHLWNNNGTWFVHYTVHPTPFTKQRIRVSLGTKGIEQAQRKRDRLLSRLADNSAPTRLQAIVSRTVSLPRPSFKYPPRPGLQGEPPALT